MPWIPLLLLLPLLLGVHCAHRLESYLRKPYTELTSSESDAILHTPTNIITNELVRELQEPVAPSNSVEQFALESGLSERFAAGRKRDLIKRLYAANECAPLEQSVQLLPYNENVDYERQRNKIMENKSGREFYAAVERNARQDATDVLSEKTKSADAAALAGERATHAERALPGKSNLLTALPVAYYTDFYEDLLVDANKKAATTEVKRSGVAPVIGCDCKIKNDLLDLGQQHFPRYLLNAVCQTEQSPNEYPQKCWRGSYCKPLEYKVKVLTFRTILDHGQKDPALAWLPDDLRQLWKFKTVTVAAGCFCSY